MIFVGSPVGPPAREGKPHDQRCMRFKISGRGGHCQVGLAPQGTNRPKEESPDFPHSQAQG